MQAQSPSDQPDNGNRVTLDEKAQHVNLDKIFVDHDRYDIFSCIWRQTSNSDWLQKFQTLLIWFSIPAISYDGEFGTIRNILLDNIIY